MSKIVDRMPAFKSGSRILFQGDSITDGNRGRNADPNHILGHGYAFIVAALYGAAYPERHLEFVNRGCSGNKVSDLVARWETDTIAVKPDLLSILIGVNDNMADVPFDVFEQSYDQLLTATVGALPQVRLVLCEPFTLPGGTYPFHYPTWEKNVKKRAVIVEKLASKYKAPFVRFQRAFDEATQRAPAEHWIWDAVHPTYSGHQIMADEWIRTVQQM